MNLSKATSSEIQVLQKKELDILIYIKKICIENKLTFFLAGGSCIGAIRHKGFIPWDDDVDIFMPRHDYEKLYKNWNMYKKNEKYSLSRSDEGHVYRHSAMTVNDNDTTFINFRTENEDVNQGIAIDILPLDYLSDSIVKRSWQRLNAIIFSIFINQRLPDNQGTILRFLTSIPLKFVRGEQRRYKIWKYCESQMIKYSDPKSKYMIELVAGLKGMYRLLDPEWFNKSEYKQFENVEMPVPQGYDNYLSLVFGDYMKLPPEKERVAKHNTVIIDTETPYKNYKGKYYLK